MNKFLPTVVLCLSALTASAGPILQSPATDGWDRTVTAALSDPAGMALHILSMSSDEQRDLALWTASQDGARDLPAAWEGQPTTVPVASVSSAPLHAASAEATRHPEGRLPGSPAPDPLAFLMLSAALTACTYALRRTRVSGPAACC
jgi:hypothetical protein